MSSTVEQGFPNSHTTTTTTQSTGTSIRLDLSYLRTTPGILKCVEIALNLLGFICIVSTIFRYDSRGSYFNTIAMVAFWFTGILLAFYLFNVPNKLSIIPWLKIEFLFCAIWSILYFIAACLAADWGVIEAFAAAAFFGFCATGCYAFDAFLKFKEIKSGIATSKATSVTVTTTTATY